MTTSSEQVNTESLIKLIFEANHKSGMDLSTIPPTPGQHRTIEYDKFLGMSVGTIPRPATDVINDIKNSIADNQGKIYQEVYVDDSRVSQNARELLEKAGFETYSSYMKGMKGYIIDLNDSEKVKLYINALFEVGYDRVHEICNFTPRSILNEARNEASKVLETANARAQDLDRSNSASLATFDTLAKECGFDNTALTDAAHEKVTTTQQTLNNILGDTKELIEKSFNARAGWVQRTQSNDSDKGVSVKA